MLWADYWLDLLNETKMFEIVSSLNANLDESIVVNIMRFHFSSVAWWSAMSYLAVDLVNLTSPILNWCSIDIPRYLNRLSSNAVAMTIKQTNKNL
ncbi:hypothetical protein PoB_005677400 [Plakobranchus ocellatus]|uniref:Uncharacterized protein n=1 Tax=Plakobranchus ocellatus TaxID=259542 RepID=A0AAV4CHJ9_9GAST|nr:hypothetical protein PoB_005677400 [Plakobranchus ocellatus]